MKIVLWGAGNLGPAIAARLTTTTFTSELWWINRSPERIAHRAIDLGHGLALTPTCRAVICRSEERARDALQDAGLVILTLGEPVRPGTTRNDAYLTNRSIYETKVVPALRGFVGVVLVVTNPCDAMARYLCRESGLPAERVIGLGTVVETARLRHSLAGRLTPARASREVWAYAIGTHDDHFVPLAPTSLGIAWTDVQLEAARKEVALAANRVKTARPESDPGARGSATLHPIVEGIVTVAAAVANDTRAILTVSTLDRIGVVHRHVEALDHPVRRRLDESLEPLRRFLAEQGELAAGA